MSGGSWQDYYYLSLGGTAPAALLQFLRDHPKVTEISLCLDNDKAGLDGIDRLTAAIQNVKPGEVTPEEANQIGYELAMKFTKGRHAFVVSTHTDKAHIHSHIEFNSTNLDCDGKFENVKDSAFILLNLKEAAKTLNFLVDNGLTDYDSLLERAEEIRLKFEEASARMKQLEGRMAQTAQMKTHIINYSKTREVYIAYKKARNKGKFRAEHRAEIEKHEAAKRAFDALGGKAIPKVA